jgi:hypothetical protein
MKTMIRWKVLHQKVKTAMKRLSETKGKRIKVQDGFQFEIEFEKRLFALIGAPKLCILCKIINCQAPEYLSIKLENTPFGGVCTPPLVNLSLAKVRSNPYGAGLAPINRDDNI